MDLDQLRRDAKALLKGFRAGDAAAVERATRVLGGRERERFLLADAQHVVAREHGHRTWPELKHAAESAELVAAVEAAMRGELVDTTPALAREALMQLVQPERDPPREAFLHVVAQADDLRDPLNVAACFDRLELVQLLLDAGADRGMSRLWGITALETALYHGARDTADLLAEHGIEPYALWSVAALGRVDLLPGFLPVRPGGHRPNLADVGWQPAPPPRDDPQEILDEALCFAALNGRDESVEWLLEHGADVNGAPYMGMTPLHFAAQFGRLSTVRLLLERGADASLRDRIHDGMPIGWAEHNGHLRVVAALGGRAEELVESGLSYREGEPVRVRIARHADRVWVTDDGRGAELAGVTRVGEDMRRRIEREFDVNVDRHGRVFLPGERFVERIGEASLALHQELLDAEG
ncbi:MAG TPA: ankyrin repeat domain-containing protein [Gaiellaceae bacterium]|nr:ankyrin repeat domain-containing protein [Gaiellaceae bacterium]